MIHLHHGSIQKGIILPQIKGFGKLHSHLCEVEYPDTDVQTQFDSITGDPPQKCYDRHLNCCAGHEPSYSRCSCLSVRVKLRKILAVGLPREKVDYLRTLLSCRHIYHEASRVLYSTNVFIFSEPETLRLFTRKVQALPRQRMLQVRNIHLQITIQYESQESTWSSAIYVVNQQLKSLRSVHINLDQQYTLPLLEKRQYVEPAKDTGLLVKRILGMAKLPLERVTVVVCDSHFRHGLYAYTATLQLPQQFRWTMAQKREWASVIRKKLLT